MLQTVEDYIEAGVIHEIHNSERKSFDACKRRWDWIYRHNYYPRTTAKPLEFGVAYHVGMETYYNPETWSFPNDVKVELAKAAFVKECEKHRAKAQAEGGFFDSDVEADYDERVALGLGMIGYYFSEISPNLDQGFTPVKVEIEFCVEVPHPDTGATMWCKCDSCKRKAKKYWDSLPPELKEHEVHWVLDPDDAVYFKGLPICFSGRIDMLAVDDDGNYWIYDWKTASAIRENKEWLELDDQIGSYVWALRVLGLNVRGFIYHEQLKGYPLPPQRNKNVRNGCSFSVSKVQTTDYDTFFRTVAKEDTEALGAGSYDAFLDFLKHEGIKFYDRRQIHKSPEQCKAVEVALGEQAIDMCSESLRTYPSPSQFSCRNCAFKVPCLEKNRGGDYEYALDSMFDQKPHYYELIRNEGSTE